MTWSIVAGMACLDETRFYAAQELGGITLAIGVCIFGILFLIKKSNKDKKL